MTTHVIRISAEQQSGKSTLALAMRNGMWTMGMGAKLIVPNQREALRLSEKHGVIVDYWRPLDASIGLARAVILDDYSKFDWMGEGDPIEIIKLRQATFIGPCQIVVFD